MRLVRQVACRPPPSQFAKLFAGVAIVTGVATWVFGGATPLGMFERRIHVCRWGTSKAEIAHATVMKYVYEAYPEWHNVTKLECPQSLERLDGLMNGGRSIDPWGNPYHFACGLLAVPAGAGPIWVISAGEDGRFGTADDIRSDR